MSIAQARCWSRGSEEKREVDARSDPQARDALDSTSQVATRRQRRSGERDRHRRGAPPAAGMRDQPIRDRAGPTRPNGASAWPFTDSYTSARVCAGCRPVRVVALSRRVGAHVPLPQSLGEMQLVSIRRADQHLVAGSDALRAEREPDERSGVDRTALGPGSKRAPRAARRCPPCADARSTARAAWTRPPARRRTRSRRRARRPRAPSAPRDRGSAWRAESLAPGPQRATGTPSRRTSVTRQVGRHAPPSAASRSSQARSHRRHSSADRRQCSWCCA